MLIVVVIIGILASALLPRLTSARDKANDVARKANVQQLMNAFSSYALDNGVWGTQGATTDSGVATFLNTAGMRSIPLDPSNTAFQFPNSYTGGSTKGFIYQPITKNGVLSWAFVVMSRAETASAANYVECGAVTSPFGTASFSGATESTTLKLCEKVTIDPAWTTCSVSTCTAKNANDLRYVAMY